MRIERFGLDRGWIGADYDDVETYSNFTVCLTPFLRFHAEYRRERLGRAAKG